MIAKSLITQNSILCMHRRVRSRATYRLRKHQFKVQQVGKGGKNMIVIDLSSHKIQSGECTNVSHSRATYPLRMHQIKVQQVGKGGKYDCY